MQRSHPWGEAHAQPPAGRLPLGATLMDRPLLHPSPCCGRGLGMQNSAVKIQRFPRETGTKSLQLGAWSFTCSAPDPLTAPSGLRACPGGQRQSGRWGRLPPSKHLASLRRADAALLTGGHSAATETRALMVRLAGGYRAGRPWKRSIRGGWAFLRPAWLDRACHGPGALSGPLFQVCSAFSAEYAHYGHVKLHHGYTNVLGLGDSSTWRLPCLNRFVYMFLAPLSIPVITPLVAVGEYARAAPCRERVPPFPYFPSWLPGGCSWRKLRAPS